MADDIYIHPEAGEHNPPHQILADKERSPGQIRADIQELADTLASAVESAPDPDGAAAELVISTGEAFEEGSATEQEAVAADVVGLDVVASGVDHDETQAALAQQPPGLLVEAIEVIEQREDNDAPSLPQHQAETQPDTHHDWWEQLPADEVSKESKRILTAEMDYLEKAEAREPLPTDEFKLAMHIRPGSVEHQALLASGLSEERSTGRNFTRAELQAAGFFFVNKIGEGEKSIIDTVIPDPNSPDGQLDLRGRSLLTRDELDKVYRYQQETGDGIGQHELRDVRADALLYMWSALRSGEGFPNTERYVEYCLPVDKPDGKWYIEPEDQAKILRYIELYKEQLRALDYPERQVSYYVSHDLYSSGNSPLSRRLLQHRTMSASGTGYAARGGETAYMLRKRFDSLHGARSPFLDSGFVFEMNPDLTVSIEDMTTKQTTLKRINMVNVHLMGGHEDFAGLSEMGGDAWDQKYMSTAEYMHHIYAMSEARKIVDLQALDLEDLRLREARQFQENLVKLVQSKDLDNFQVRGYPRYEWRNHPADWTFEQRAQYEQEQREKTQSEGGGSENGAWDFSPYVTGGMETTPPKSRLRRVIDKVRSKKRT